MMAGPMLELGNTESLLTCSICLEDMVGRQPRSLSCLHSYCHQCLKDLLGFSHSHNLTCPTCKRETLIGKKGLKGLPVDFRVQQFADELKARTTVLNCDVCNVNKVVSKCHHVDCGLKLCRQCTNRHNKQPLFKEHVVVALNEENQEAFICEKHSREVRYMCHQCLVGACATCVLDDNHCDHETELVNLDEGLKTHKQEVKALCEKYQEELEPKVVYWGMTKRRLGTLQEMDNNITNRASEITSSVIQETEELRQYLKENFTESTKSIVDTFNMLEIAQNGLCWSLHMVNSDPKTFLKNLNPMTEYMKNTIECIKSYVTVDLKPLPNMEISRGKNTVATISNREDTEAVDEDSVSQHQPSFILHVHQVDGIELVNPREISQIDDQTVIVADTGLSFAFILNEKCEVVLRCRPTEALSEQGISSVSCTYGVSTSFFLTHHNINALFEKTKSNLLLIKHSLPSGIQNIASIAVDENQRVILACRNRLIVYDLETMEYISIAENFANACRVKIEKYKKEKMYLVCDTDAGVIYIYTYESIHGGGINKEDRIRLSQPDSHTKLLYQSPGNEGKNYVIQYEGVSDATFNSAGNLLVADRVRKSIREVMVTGEVKGDILSMKDGLTFPASIAYSKGKLWVTECDPFLHCSSIKLFNLKDFNM